MATDLSPRDVALLQAAADGMSGNDMAKEFGIPAAKAILRVKELLRSYDIWTDIERRQLLMQEIYALKNKLQAQNGDYINWSSVILPCFSNTPSMATIVFSSTSACLSLM